MICWLFFFFFWKGGGEWGGSEAQAHSDGHAVTTPGGRKASLTRLFSVSFGRLPSGRVSSRLVPSGLVSSGCVPSRRVPSWRVSSGLIPSGRVPSRRVPSRRVWASIALYSSIIPSMAFRPFGVTVYLRASRSTCATMSPKAIAAAWHPPQYARDCLYSQKCQTRAYQ
jgi:hypothetical protein